LETAGGRLEQDAVGDLRELDAAVVVGVAGGVGQREGQLDRVVDGGVAGVGVEDEDALGQPGGDAAEGDFRFEVLPGDQGRGGNLGIRGKEQQFGQVAEAAEVDA